MACSSEMLDKSLLNCLLIKFYRDFVNTSRIFGEKNVMKLLRVSALCELAICEFVNLYKHSRDMISFLA